ncbi:hypothetical protein IW140_004330 [Coemansia sp. RSA 1813]|nr:hypothetical protein EV178_004402 [Coemansia sp. RSA 1646]KAJ1769411.1 hypothetical protein LPJ74_004074 [Coemansia sp. RSA 1843]KAJ2211322.1 hypothetical protein EV179_005589 [Coemansia sp. RSA 487]KAJ2567820.1 hypothetical protein IW140_004330 [Coemansia sp. RSA 1813]
MPATDSSNPPDPSLLRLSACTNLAQLAATLDELTLDPAAVLEAVPECLDSRGLAALVFNHVSEQLSADTAQSEEWTSACVARAEAVDRWTGRIDWAVQWLEAIKEQQVDKQAAPDGYKQIDDALQRAMLLQSVVLGEREGATAYSPATSGVTLADLNAMTLDDLVAWALARVSELSDLADPVLAVLELDASKPDGSLLRAAWNRWWTRNMVGSPHKLLNSLITQHPQLFDTHIVLAAIYAVGGPCSDIAAANDALSVLARLTDAKSSSGAVVFPESIWHKIRDAQPESFASLTAEEIPAVLGTTLAQIETGKTLARLGLDVDVPTIAACQQGMDDQQRLLVKLILSALRLGATRPEGVPLWSELVHLHSAGLFSCLPLESIKQEYLQRLLSGEQFEQAQALIDAQPPFTNTHVVRDAVCQAACEMFDNAESGNMDTGLVRSASRCLDVLPAFIQRNDPAVKKERTLIDAAHLVWTLGASGFSAIFKSSDRATLASGEVLPIEIRLSSDPYTLLKDILARTPGGYKKQRIVREIAAKLQEIAALSKESKESLAASGAANDAANSEPVPSRRDLGVHSVSEALVAALLLEAATNSADYSAAYDYTRQLANARPVLARAQAATEVYRSKQLLGSGTSDLADTAGSPQQQPVQIEVRAIECIWRACVELAAKWSSNDQWDSSTAARSSVANERRLEVASIALGLCPTGEIPRILQLWNQIQADHLTNSPEPNDLSSWAEPLSLDQTDNDPVSIVHETLIGSTVAAQPAKADTPLTASDTSDTDVVNLDSIRTFDAAIIKRCLRLTLAATDDAMDTQRRELLLEWLDFALTTAKKPKDSRDAAFGRRMEADVAKRYPQEAIRVLVARVLPQLDQTNYAMLEAFYAFYARCLQSAGDAEGEQQALVRLALAKQISQDASEVVQSMRFADVVAPFACANDAECHAVLSEKGQAFWPAAVEELVRLTPDLAKLRPLNDTDSPRKGVWWAESGSMLASRLCLWALTDVATNASLYSETEEQIYRMFNACLPHMSSVEDISALAGFLAFSAGASRPLGLDTRYDGVSMCCEHITNNIGQALPPLAKDAQAYMEYAVGLRAIQDPFTFASLSDQWTAQLDVCATPHNEWGFKDKPPADLLCDACIDVLGQMAADESVAAYFVCECYMRVQDLVGHLDQDGVRVPELSQVYMQVIQCVISEHSQSSGSNDGALGKRLKAIAEPPMELCSFNFGDGSALGAVMKTFSGAFSASLIKLARSSALDSSVQLALLEAVDHHSVGSHALESSSAVSSDLLHFCLLADKHWGVKIEQTTEACSIEGRCAAWLKLLHNTSADKKQLIDVLVALLVRWSAAGGQGREIDQCVSALIEWGVRDQAPCRVVRAIVNHEGLFTQIAGTPSFGLLLEDARRSPSMVAPLATLGLAYPSDAWAEQCMELVIYVMAAGASASTQTQDPDAVAVDSEDADTAWDIDDDDLLLESGDELQPQPQPVEYGRACAMVLDSAALHVAIVARGYVAACAGSPQLLDALGRTLLQAATVSGLANSDDQALVDALVIRDDPQIMASLAAGMQPAHELLRRAIYAAHSAGMRDQALAWIYELVDMPLLYRFAASDQTVERWLVHVDRLVLGETAEIKPQPSPPLPLPTQIDETETEEAVADDGWGDDDLDLDADLEKL